MKCPICKKAVEFGAPLMPFCSERCKLIDLGNWSEEKYVISTPASPVEVRAAQVPRDLEDDL